MIGPSDVPPDVVRWLAFGERGVSSETIVSQLTGLQVRSLSHPHDPDDLRRCVLMLDACPSLAARIGEMRSASPEWAALVDVWSELVESLRSETAAGRQAPITYALMRKAIDRSRRGKS